MKKNKLRSRAVVTLLAIAFTAAPVSVRASANDIESVNEMITALPETEDITDSDAESVEAAMDAYKALDTAEKSK